MSPSPFRLRSLCNGIASYKALQYNAFLAGLANPALQVVDLDAGRDGFGSENLS
jgi:hypothetical protein